MIAHSIKWTAPSPLWAGVANATTPAVRLSFNQPTILRFAADSFMEDFIKILETDPEQIHGLVAKYENWRGAPPPPKAQALLEPAEPVSSLARKINRIRLATERLRAGSLTAEAANPPAQLLKLYQPAHGRYYLVTACLVCGITGLPDRVLDAGKQERVAFVLRRLVNKNKNSTEVIGDPQDFNEHALTMTPRGVEWKKITGNAETLIPGEERLPMFPVSFAEDDGRTRRLFAGLIPAGKREAYLGAPQSSQDKPGSTEQSASPEDPRMLLLYAQVTEAWKRLLELADVTRKTNDEPVNPPPSDVNQQTAVENALIKATREQVQTASWYIALDFAKFLNQYLNPVWLAVSAGNSAGLTNQNAINLFNALRDTTLGDTLKTALKTNQNGNPSAIYQDANIQASLLAALKAIVNFETKLESASISYDREKADPGDATKPDPTWPALLFPLADPEVTAPLPPMTPAPTGTLLERAQKRIDHLANLVRLALPKETDLPMPAPSLVSQKPLDVRDSAFVIRCVFERPNCGPLEPAIVSAATVPFQLANFFDPDAPARPLRIALPMDTSPAGLRKFDKNTAFMISDMLCGQVDRVKGLSLGDLIRSVLPWPLHKDLSVPDKGPCPDNSGASLSAGMMCSFSIPIITICALLLLMIIVSLLDLIFRWMPYFFICFPLPGFKAKK